MSTHKTPQSQQLLKLVETAPFTQEEKTRWSSTLHEAGITTELAEEIHKTLSELPAEKFEGDWEKARFNMELAALLKQWRMSEASKNFKHNR
jgi:hypothetical protein